MTFLKSDIKRRQQIKRNELTLHAERPVIQRTAGQSTVSYPYISFRAFPPRSRETHMYFSENVIRSVNSIENREIVFRGVHCASAHCAHNWTSEFLTPLWSVKELKEGRNLSVIKNCGLITYQ